MIKFDDVQNNSLEEQVVNYLLQHNETISCAESCTGGLLSGRIINVAGVSAAYKQGYITYSDEAKEQVLHIPKNILEQYTAVSDMTARKMAEGVCNITNSDWSLATTGYAGPEGGENGDPAGLVYIACCHHGQTWSRKLLLTGTRQQIREEAVTKALCLLAQQMNGDNI